MIYTSLTFATKLEAYQFFDSLEWKPGAKIDGTTVWFFRGWHGTNAEATRRLR